MHVSRFKPTSRSVLAALAIFASSCFSSRTLAVAELVDLGDVLANTPAMVTGVSADGNAVAGHEWYFDPMGWFPPPDPASRAFLWTPATGMVDLGTLGGSSAWANALSRDGIVVAGVAFTGTQSHAFRWTAETGMVDLGTLGGPYSTASALNADGSVVVGSSRNRNNQEHAFRWTAAKGMRDLGTLGGSTSSAAAVSWDGNAVVGRAQRASGQYRAFRWTSAMGMVDLGVMGGTRSNASGVSADGSVVIGTVQFSSPTDYRAFRWTQATGMTDLGTLGGSYSNPHDVSANGSTIVGSSSLANGRVRAFRWTPATGMHNLRTLGGSSSESKAVSGDGNVVVGAARDVTNEHRAFRWTQASGMQSVEAWLTDNGATVGTTVPRNATYTDFDGSVVAGMLTNGHAYIARVGEFGNGLITPEDVSDSLSSTGRAVDAILTTAGTLIHGAHSRPLSRRVAKGKHTGWLAGDWGRDDHDRRDGSIGLAEAGYGYNFGPAQVNVAIGKTWADQDIVHGGDIDADGHFLVTEAIVPVNESRGLFATLGAYGHWGDADIRRGYLNAGLPDQSKGEPDTRSWGLRARVDWEDAFSVSRTRFSPYADISYTDARLDSYKEEGGGFPAHFEQRDEEVKELRAGVNGEMPFKDTPARLLLNLEATHRFDDDGPRTSGQMLGLFGFDLDGRDYDQTWFRGGIGVEGDLGGGKASVMLNGTTKGEMPNVWLAASYQMTF